MTADTPAATRAALVAARIRALRTARGWTQAELARAVPEANLSGSQISKIESGRRTVDVDELAALAEALTTTLEHLVRAGIVCGTCGQEIT
jgi:transcriptional regulator with XRE-family HTH domain